MDTPDFGVEFCPGCNPQDVFEHLEGDKVWEVRWHERCLPGFESPDDTRSALEGHFMGGTESAGETNRAIQALIR